MRVIAHRGNSHLAPQNTIAAFDAARRSGAHMIELDIQVLADGNAAIIHDDDVDDLTDGTGPVNSFTTETIKELDAGSWFSPAFTGEPIPLFSDLLEFLSEPGSPSILLEAKGVWEEEPLKRVLDAINAADMGERFVFQSFAEQTVARAAELAPQIRREWLLEEWREDAIDVAYDLHVEGVNPSGLILLEHPDFVDEVHGAGLSVSTWTLNEPEQWQAARTIGVDGIITDRPAMLLGWLCAHV